MNTATQVETVRSMTNKEMVLAIVELQKQVAELTAKLADKPKTEGIEMTDEHAQRVTYGDLAELKHKEAAEKLNITYGQVYSCRLELTFKTVHKAMKDSGKTNRWVK